MGSGLRRYNPAYASRSSLTPRPLSHAAGEGEKSHLPRLRLSNRLAHPCPIPPLPVIPLRGPKVRRGEDLIP